MAENTVEKQEEGPSREEQLALTREATRYLTPAVDIYETEAGLTLLADMPEVPKENLKIRVEEGILTIVGDGASPWRSNPLVKEFELASFYRQFQLTEEVDSEKICAELKNGVLTLSLPKKEKAKPREIPIKVV